MSKRLEVFGLLVIASLCLGAAPGAPSEAQGYIVVLNDRVDPAAVSAKHHRSLGVVTSQVYKHAVKGYAAKLSAAMLDALEGDADVVSIYRDQQVKSAAAKPCTDLSQCQAISIAVDRIDGELSSTRSGDGKGAVNINVAVLDDGGPVLHPDLNVRGSVDCLKGD
jgi:subtilisin